jgi:hypothetical protein
MEFIGPRIIGDKTVIKEDTTEMDKKLQKHVIPNGKIHLVKFYLHKDAIFVHELYYDSVMEIFTVPDICLDGNFKYTWDAYVNIRVDKDIDTVWLSSSERGSGENDLVVTDYKLIKLSVNNGIVELFNDVVLSIVGIYCGGVQIVSIDNKLIPFTADCLYICEPHRHYYASDGIKMVNFSVPNPDGDIGLFSLIKSQGRLRVVCYEGDEEVESTLVKPCR